MALSIVLVYIHARLAASSGAYTSFCNVSESINCDVVLASPFATLFGVPVAVFALLAYAAIAAFLQGAARAGNEIAARCLQLACIAIFGAVAFSGYMAFVSMAVLETVCLMCSGLYLVTAALLVIALVAPSRFAAARPGTRPPLAAGAMATLLVVAIVGVAGLARATWPASIRAGSELMSLDELRDTDPDFYEWYTSLPVVSAPPDDRNVFGDPGAAVTIIEFSDFLCGYCARNHRMLKDLVARRPGLVRVIYRHFPLDAACNEALESSLHPRACRAAESAECARLQDRFDEMADALFANQQRLFEENLFKLAEQLGLDMPSFRECMDDHRTRNAVLADTRVGNRLDITSTPTLFINGRKVVGALPDIDKYETAILIESRLARDERLLTDS